jgi:hypothetical protein
LARVYLHAWQVTGVPFYRTIVEETLDYIAREMISPEGDFHATQDADSEGEGIKLFAWTPDEVRAVLGAQADPCLSAYEVTERGNFEGRNILKLTGSLGERDSLANARRRLLEAREKRVHPGRHLWEWTTLAENRHAQDATRNPCTPNGDDHAKVVLGFGAYGRSAVCSVMWPILPLQAICHSETPQLRGKSSQGPPNVESVRPPQ